MKYRNSWKLYNSWGHSDWVKEEIKKERTQMSLNRRIDTENVVHLYNGVLLSNEKQRIYEILGEMDISGEYHPEWGNTITKEVTWYALTDKWILSQKPRIPKILLLKHKKIKKKDQCVDTSFLPRIWKKYPWKELQRQSLELRWKDGPTRGSIP